MVLKRKEKQMLKQNLDGKYPERIKIPVQKGRCIVSNMSVNGFSNQLFNTDEMEDHFIEASFVKQQGHLLVYVTDLLEPWEYYEAGKSSLDFTSVDRNNICKHWFDCDAVKLARNIDKMDLDSMTKDQIFAGKPYWLNFDEEERNSFFSRSAGMKPWQYKEYKDHKVITTLGSNMDYETIEVDLTGTEPEFACLRATLYIDAEEVQVYEA